MAQQALILTEKDILEIDLTLVRLIKESEAKCALLVDQDGRMLARKGFTKNLDCEALAALLAGSFASTKAIAKLVGEPEFSIMFHQGEHDKIQNNMVDENTILCIIFDDRTTIGMVRVYAKEAADKVARTLATARAQNRVDDSDYSEMTSGAASALDSLFGGNEPEPSPASNRDRAATQPDTMGLDDTSSSGFDADSTLPDMHASDDEVTLPGMDSLDPSADDTFPELKKPSRSGSLEDTQKNPYIQRRSDG